MDEKITDEQLIAYIEGEGNNRIEKILEEDPDTRQRYEELKSLMLMMQDSTTPEAPDHILPALQDAIIAEQSGSGMSVRFPWYQIAASLAILLVGFALGKWSSDNSRSDEFMVLQDEIRSLRSSQIVSGIRQSSASERIMAVNKIQHREEIDPDLAVTLLHTLNSDESPNVRYAALQALKGYVDDLNIRSALVRSLELQQDPLIQISLISILLEASEKSMIVPVKKLLNRENTTPEVRKQAKIALKILT